MNNKKNTLAGGVLLLLCVLAAILFFHFRADPISGRKEITVIVVHGDLEEKTFVYETESEFLGEVLAEHGLAQGTEGPYGVFITTVDGETADETKQQWWCITKDGEMLNTSAGQTPVQNQEQYELTLKEGY